MIAQGYKGGLLVCEFSKPQINTDQNGYDIDTLVVDGVSHDVAPEEPAPLTDVDIAKQYQQAYQAAEGIIFLLMGRVAPTLIQKKYCTPENVNAEGTKFMQFHRDIIQDFKNSGRHPDAGDQMYDDFVGSEQTFPWVKDVAILAIFATTIPRNES